MAGKALSTHEGVQKSTERFWGGLLATFLTVAVSHLVGLETEEILGAVILGYSGAKLIVNKVLPKIVTRFRAKNTDIAEANQKKQALYNTESMEYNTGLGNKIGKSTKKILTGAAITYAVSHYIAPSVIKLLANSPQLSSVLAALSLAVPGLQIAAVTVFTITAIIVIKDRINAYRDQQRDKVEKPSEFMENDLTITDSEIHITAEKETLCGIFGLVVMNAGLAAFQVATLLIGAKVVTPIAALTLAGFIGAYTLFYTIPKGTYNITMAFRKTDVSKLGMSKSPSEEPENEKKKGIDISPSNVNKAMGLAITGIIAHHGVKMLFNLPFIQHLAVIATGFLATSAIVLVVIPRMVNKSRLKSFKQSDVFQQVSSRLSDSPQSESNLSRSELEEAVTNLYQSRPDIVIATLMCSHDPEVDDSTLESAIVKHGFSGVEIFIDKLSDDVLKTTLSQSDLSETTLLQGPYFNKPTKTLELAAEAPKHAKEPQKTSLIDKEPSNERGMRM